MLVRSLLPSRLPQPTVRCIHFTAKLLPGELAVEARTLDATDAADDRAMLHAVASVWEFPDYFSHNWDAADECLRDLDAWLPAKGYWFPPTVFSGVSQSHKIAREEIFGPVLAVLTFRTPEEAVAKANNTPYGLSAGVWTEKGSRILWMAGKLRAGVVWANTYNRFDPASPFGGYQESGFGREGGRAGLAAYLDA